MDQSIFRIFKNALTLVITVKTRLMIDMLRRSNLFIEIEYNFEESGSIGATCYL